MYVERILPVRSGRLCVSLTAFETARVEVIVFPANFTSLSSRPTVYHPPHQIPIQPYT